MINGFPRFPYIPSANMPLEFSCAYIDGS